MGLDFTTAAADIDETAHRKEPPGDFAVRMAMEKAHAIAAQQPNACVIGGDTVVTIGDKILGKPGSEHHALEMLRELSGRTHRVITGLAIVCREKKCSLSLARTTRVTFSSFADSGLKAYVNTREPMDKAGAYGIQGQGAFLVREIEGSCSNVIGLPLSDCIALLLEHDFIIPAY
jgi:septum formation protein